MGVTWKRIEKNIYQCAENPKKYKIILYYGRDERNKLISSSKVVEGNLTEARRILKLHEAALTKKTAQKPTKVTLQELLDNWNSNIVDVQNAQTTQTSTKNLQRHMTEYFGDIRVDKLNTSSIRTYMAYEIYSPEEAKELLLALRESGRYDLEVAVNLAFWCGCRREETCALKWGNVDLGSREIKICQVRTTAKGMVVERKSTKNKEIRMVGILDWLHDCLVRVKHHQDEMRGLLQEEYFAEREYVFCHDNGRP